MLCTINGIAGLEALGMANTFGQVKESGESVKVTLQADNDFYSQVQRVGDGELETCGVCDGDLIAWGVIVVARSRQGPDAFASARAASVPATSFK